MLVFGLNSLQTRSTCRMAVSGTQEDRRGEIDEAFKLFNEVHICTRNSREFQLEAWPSFEMGQHGWVYRGCSFKVCPRVLPDECNQPRLKQCLVHASTVAAL